MMHNNPLFDEMATAMGMHALRAIFNAQPDSEQSKREYIRRANVFVTHRADQNIARYMEVVAEDPLNFMFNPNVESIARIVAVNQAQIDDATKQIHQALFAQPSGQSSLDDHDDYEFNEH